MGNPAARISDFHTCPDETHHKPHVGGPVVSGVPNVLIGGAPAATMGSVCQCNGPPDSVVMGSPTVLIGGKPAARMGDATAHGGVMVVGCPTVLVG
ncbi:MAG TPA: PAAR domain-containing protein [Pseudomonadales bacterium]|nr:PAAR domain-containing protein [Pseudomonadales bacterium]